MTPGPLELISRQMRDALSYTVMKRIDMHRPPADYAEPIDLLVERLEVAARATNHLFVYVWRDETDKRLEGIRMVNQALDELEAILDEPFGVTVEEAEAAYHDARMLDLFRLAYEGFHGAADPDWRP
jgi:hypothetical protein